MSSSAILPYIEMPSANLPGFPGIPSPIRAFDLRSEEDLFWEGFRQFFEPNHHTLSVLAQVDLALTEFE